MSGTHYVFEIVIETTATVAAAVVLVVLWLADRRSSSTGHRPARVLPWPQRNQRPGARRSRPSARR